MKIFVFVLILTFCNMLLFAQTVIPAGNVSGYWLVSGSPYLIEGEIIIPDGETLIIDPGCLIEFQGHYEVKIFGLINAVGTQQDSIRFTALDTELGWFGLRFQEIVAAADTSKFKHCIFEYGKATGVASYHNGGALYINSGHQISITNCRFSNNFANHRGGAIYCTGSTITIIESKLSRNIADQYTGGAIHLDGSTLNIDECEISNNHSDDHGGAIYCRNSELQISNCTISFNIDHHGDSGALYCSGSEVEIIDNSINNNCSYGDGEGAILLMSSNGIISDNTIFDNLVNYESKGASIYCKYSEVEIQNNIINNNEGTGIIISCSETQVENNIITNSEYNGIRLYGDQFSLVTQNEIYNNESCGIKLEHSSTRIEKNIINQSITGIYCKEDSSPTLRNNVIHNCSEYGIYIDESNPIILNCTIVDNQSFAIYSRDNSTIILVNSILWGSPYNTISSSNSEFYISNCCIENGTSSMNFTPDLYENNITENPEFIGTEYYLSNNSPCIDAGAQWIGTDSDGSIIDIGCYTTFEFAGSGELPPNMVSGFIAGKISEDVILFGDVTVNVDDQLIINPGIKISCFGTLNILGSIVAIGTPSLYVEFTGVDQFPWNGIYIEGNSNFINEFEFCKFNNSTSSALSDVNTNLKIANCEFYDNSASKGGAVSLVINIDESINIDILHNYFHDNNSIEKGGAVYIYNRGENCTTDIYDNTFIDNEGGWNGGAIYGYNYNFQTQMEYVCLIHENYFSQNESGNGGAISSSYRAIIENNTIINNEGYIGGGVFSKKSKVIRNTIEKNEASYGGGIYSESSEIFNNIIRNNTALSGGGIYLDRNSDINDSKIVGNLISSNNATYNGGGIFATGDHEITNCTISNNQSNTGAGYYCENSFNSLMNNCIVWGNSALEDSTQIYLNAHWYHDYEPGVGEIHEWRPANLNIYYSDIEGGYEEIGINYAGSTPEYPITYDFEYEDNFNLDPLFLSEENFHFYVNSPCINAGTPDTIGLSLPEYDLDGNQRILGNSIDLGCFESQVAFVEHNEIDFGDIQVMTMSEAIEVLIINPLDQEIQISSISASENYFIKLLPEHDYVEQILNILVPATSQVSFWVACSPKEEGQLDGEIDIVSNNFSSENTIATSANGIYVFKLYNNYPNPFNPETTILFSIPQESKVELTVYNLRGQKVKTLVDHTCEMGINTAIWNGTNDSGKRVSTGVYFYNLNVDGKTIKTKKMLLLK